MGYPKAEQLKSELSSLVSLRQIYEASFETDPRPKKVKLEELENLDKMVDNKCSEIRGIKYS